MGRRGRGGGREGLGDKNFLAAAGDLPLASLTYLAGTAHRPVIREMLTREGGKRKSAHTRPRKGKGPCKGVYTMKKEYTMSEQARCNNEIAKRYL